jgi:DNA-binding transcriptional ArsR family regulator
MQLEALGSMARKTNSENGTETCCRAATAPKLSRGRAREYAGWFKALADPTRVRILNLLAANREPVCVCDIVKHFPIGQPTISHHLKILRATRFVQSERRGTFMYYRVNRNCLGEFPNAARLIMDV